MLPLRGFVLGLVPDRHLADDIVQQTFVVACRKAADFLPGTNFRAWIFTIARYETLAALRRQSVGRDHLLGGDVVELLAGEQPDDLDFDDRVAALDSCIGRLARTARRILTLRYMENLGPSEIAPKIGWSANAISVALSRARQFLRKCVEHQQSRAAAPVKP